MATTKEAPAKGAKNTEATVKTNGQETATATETPKKKKEAPKSYKDMTSREKVCVAVKSALAFSKANKWAGVEIDVKDENGVVKTKKAFDSVSKDILDEDGKVTGQLSDGDFAYAVERKITVKAYPAYKKEGSKISEQSDEAFARTLELAKASLTEQKAKKYGKGTSDLINYILRMKGVASVKGFNADVIADLEL